MTTTVDSGRQEDPLVSFHFGVIVDNWLSEESYFTEVSGVGSEQEVIEHKVVKNGIEVVLKIPGRLKWENVVLKRGITSNMDLWHWRKEVETGNVDSSRANGTIFMYDQHLTPVAEWTFNNAWPVKISGPSIKSDSNEIGVEELTIAHEYIVRVS